MSGTVSPHQFLIDSLITYAVHLGFFDAEKSKTILQYCLKVPLSPNARETERTRTRKI